jgi:hypothetical protein
MRQKKINPKDLKIMAAQRGIVSLAALARRIGCSRPVIYFALENPKRYSRVYGRILEEVA